MDTLRPFCFSVLGISLIGVGVLVRSFPLLDQLANLDFAYLVTMLGLTVLVVGIHCLLFASPVHDLPLIPTIVVFAIIAGAANGNIVWDAVAFGAEKDVMWQALSNSAEFSIYYAAFLFLPRWRRREDRNATVPATTESGSE